MQQAPSKTKGSLGTPELPSFSDRLPDLITAVRSASNELSQAQDSESYIPYWEDLYSVVHSMKGILNLLTAPKFMTDFIMKFSDLLNDALNGAFLARDKKSSSQIFNEIADLLERPEFKFQEGDPLFGKVEQLQGSLSQDLGHQERLKEMPSHLFYVNELVSKKAREVKLLGFNDCVVEDVILLDQIPFWRAQLLDALRSPEFGRGFIVNFLPFLSPEGSRSIRVWAWIAAASNTRAALKQRVKDVMPRVHIAKV